MYLANILDDELSSLETIHREETEAFGPSSPLQWKRACLSVGPSISGRTLCVLQ